MNLFSLLFSPNGRMNREKFLVISLAVSVINVGFIWGLRTGGYIAILIIFAYIGICVSVKRLHDMSNSGFWVLLLLAPLVNIGAFISMATVRGDKGPNRYGDDPLAEENHALDDGRAGQM